jgi:hypothetical protein
MLKKQRQQLSWRYFLLPLSMLITAAIVVFLFTWHLNSQTPGLSPYEQQASNSSSTIQSIKNNPVNAPHKLLQYAIQNNVGKSAGWLRMASVITALIFIGFLFILLYQWFGGFIAITGTLFFATTPWIILLARNASADIMLLSPIAIVTSIIWLDRTSKKPNRAWLFLMTVTALSLYTPGILWFVFIATLLAYKFLSKDFARVQNIYFFLGFLIFILLLMPLGYGIYQHTSTARELLLIPKPLPDFFDVIKNIFGAIISYNIRSYQLITYNIGHLPILNIAGSALSILGFYALWQGAKNHVAWLAGLVALAIAMSALTNDIKFLSVGLPVFGVLIAAGLRYLYMNWFRVFPRNPLPKTLAIMAIIFLVGMQLVYGYSFSLIAWQHTVATKTTYVLK